MTNQNNRVASFLAASIFTLGVCGPAIGQSPDTITHDPYGYNAPQSRSYDWSGLYVGAQLQSLRYSWDARLDTGSTETLGWDSSSASLGGHAGYQKQFGSCVAGGEVSVTPMNSAFSSDSTTSAGLHVAWKVAELYQVSAKLGYATGRFLVDAHAGIASAKITTTTSGNYPSSSSANSRGWSGGLGVDYALTKRIIAGVGYEALTLPVESMNLTDGTLSSTFLKSDLGVQSLKLRLSVKFD